MIDHSKDVISILGSIAFSDLQWITILGCNDSDGPGCLILSQSGPVQI